jgi:hypothetical protein
VGRTQLLRKQSRRGKEKMLGRAAPAALRLLSGSSSHTWAAKSFRVLDARRHILDGKTRMKYSEGRLNDFTAHD